MFAHQNQDLTVAAAPISQTLVLASAWLPDYETMPCNDVPFVLTILKVPTALLQHLMRDGLLSNSSDKKA